MVISNRSVITCFYEVEREDGWRAKFHSSQGNEHIQEARSEAIGSDVIANNVIAYFQWRPYEGGIEIWSCLKMDPMGMIPNFLKNKMSQRMGNALLILVDYI